MQLHTLQVAATQFVFDDGAAVNGLVVAVSWLLFAMRMTQLMQRLK
jgi:hypothetical protein